MITVEVGERRGLTGDFVCSWAFGEDFAGFHPEGFFHCEEALALDESALDLTIVHCWVNGSSDILQKSQH